MKVEINVDSDVEPKRIFEYMKRFCIEHFQKFKLKVGNLEYEQI